MEVRVAGGSTMLTPDELYGEYIITAACLPIDATTRSITLCSSFFNFLITLNQDKIEDNNFSMPPLNYQSSKTLQLSAL